MGALGSWDAVPLFRCVQCGKWSHANRRPLWHQRWIDRDDGLPEGAVVLGEIEPYGGEYTEHVPGGWFIRCGPFAEWRAMPVEEAA